MKDQELDTKDSRVDLRVKDQGLDIRDSQIGFLMKYRESNTKASLKDPQLQSGILVVNGAEIIMFPWGPLA